MNSLEQRIAELEVELTKELASYIRLRQRLADAEDRCNALKVDAERYRWLRVRNELRDDMDPRGPYPVDDDGDGLPRFLTGEELDTAIDIERMK